MAGLLGKIAAYGGLGAGPGAYATNKSFRKGVNSFLGGTPEIRENVSSLRPEQEPLYQQLTNAGMNPGAGGAFGTSADYYRNLLSDNPEDMNAFAAPEMRNFRENIIPDLSEQFARMGSGGLSSSGFRNAAVGAGTDLAERLGAIRANLRQSGAQGLSNIGQMGLNPYSQNMVTQQGTPGFLSQIAPAIGSAAGSAIGGPVGGAIGNMGGNWLSNSFGGNKVGVSSSPYGNGGAQNASPQFSSNLPSFNPNMRR